MKLRVLMAAVLCALWVAAPLAALPLRTVALSFETTPHNVSGLTLPLINDLGQTAFLGGYGARPGQVDSYHTGTRAWSEAAGALAAVAGIGDVLPNAPNGKAISAFNQFGFNNAGRMALRIVYGTNLPFATYIQSSNGLEYISKTGDPTPGLPNYTFGPLDSFSMNNASQIAVRCDVYLSASETFDSIWRQEIGAMDLAKVGKQIGAPVFNDNGILAYQTITSEIWLGQPGSVQRIAARGQATPGTQSGETFNFMADPVINSAGHAAFSSSLFVSGGSGIWSNHSGALTLIARNGDLAPDTSESVVFAKVSAPVLNDADHIAFHATLAVGGDVTTANDSGIWSDASGSLALIAREGNPAPSVDGAVFGQFDINSYTLNVLGQTAFVGRLIGAGVTTANDVGIWATDQTGALQLIAREGDSLEVGPGDTRIIKELLFFTGTGNGDSRMSGFNELGQLAYWARFADNSEGLVDNSEGIFVSYAVAASIPGDFNHDGNVDSADYVAWRKTDGTELGYNTWRTHFGVTSTPASIATSLVPEPSTMILGAAFACVLSLQQRRARFTRLSATCSASALPANGLLQLLQFSQPCHSARPARNAERHRCHPFIVQRVRRIACHVIMRVP